jgi:uncharacterized protein Yka (UPF0111/DUF47 family)
MPDMREKIKEYIEELDQEIQRCEDAISVIKMLNTSEYIALESRMIALSEVKNDLISRLEELI